MSHRHDHDLKCDPAPRFLTDTRATTEIERDIRAGCRETIRTAKVAPWKLGHRSVASQVRWARIRHSESIARESTNAA